MEYNPYTEVMYCIPIDPETEKPLPSASNVIFYAPYAGAIVEFKKDGIPGHIRKFAEEYGYTVITLTIVSGDKTRHHPQKYYVHNTSGWHDIALKAVRHIQEQYNLGNRKLMITGDSSGGTMAYEMCICYPDIFEAAAWCGGTSYDMPLPQNFSIPVLAMNPWGCPGEAPTHNLAKLAAKNSCPIWASTLLPRGDYVIAEGYEHHYTPAQGMDAMRKFIAGCIQLREKSGGVLPPPSEWPVQLEQNGMHISLPNEEVKQLWDQMPSQSLKTVVDGRSLLMTLPSLNGKPDALQVTVMPSDEYAVKGKDLMYCGTIKNKDSACFMLYSSQRSTNPHISSKLLEAFREWIDLPEHQDLKIRFYCDDQNFTDALYLANTFASRNVSIWISPMNSTSHTRERLKKQLPESLPFPVHFYQNSKAEIELPEYAYLKIHEDPKIPHLG